MSDHWLLRLLSAALPIAVVFGSAAYAAFASRLPPHAARAGAAAAGAAVAFLFAARVAWVRVGAQIGEARRLGYRVGFGLRGLRLEGGNGVGETAEQDLARARNLGEWECRCRYEFLQVWFGLYFILVPFALLYSWASLWLPVTRGLRLAAGLLASAISLPWLLSQAYRAAAKGPESSRADFRRWDWVTLRYKRLVPVRREKIGEDLRAILTRAVGLRPGQKVAELGAGAGVLWEHLPAGEKRSWILVDVDAAAIHYCRSLGIGTRWVCADARKLPFEPASIDGVVGMSFFDSIFDRQLDDILEEARRVLRPGGFLLHLQNFVGWPGPDIRDALNPLLAEVGVVGGVTCSLLTARLRFPRADGGALKPALRRLAEDAAGLRQDRLRFLERYYEEASSAGYDSVDPKLAFNRLFALALRRHGFKVLPQPAELLARLHYTSFVAARRP